MYPPEAGKIEYHLGRWQTDPNKGRISTGLRRYPVGYHVGLSRELAIKIAKDFSSGGYCGPRSFTRRLVTLECSYRKVVASEMSDIDYGGVKVAMVMQFGYRGVKNNKPIIWTGGLSALEGAFIALGWDDPHYLPEQGYTCEVKGCMEEDTCGMHWGDSPLYLRLCSKHHMQAWRGEPMPEIKQYALDREAKRDPETGILPLG